MPEASALLPLLLLLPVCETTRHLSVLKRSDGPPANYQVNKEKDELERRLEVSPKVAWDPVGIRCQDSNTHDTPICAFLHGMVQITVGVTLRAARSSAGPYGAPHVRSASLVNNIYLGIEPVYGYRQRQSMW